MDETTNTPTQAELMNAPPPPTLPARFWIMVDNGLMTREAAVAAWAKEVAAGAKYDPLG